VPVVPQVANLTSPPTNTYGLVQYVAQRIPGYDGSEYLRELNAAYIHVWEEISKLGNAYFTNIVQVSVTAAGANKREFDLLYNADLSLSAAVSSRLYQIMRVRVQPPSGGLFQMATLFPIIDPDFVSLEANPAAQSTQTGPYYFTIYGHGKLRSAIPLAQNSVIEIMYSYWPIALQQLSAGTVANAANVITGTGTGFTGLVPPDFQPTLPTAGSVNEEFIQAELVCNASQIYRVTGITTDTALTTLNSIAPVLAPGSAYVLGTVPEIPREHIRVIAALALSKLFSVAGDDQRVQEWTAIATANIQMMKDSLIERQQNNPPKKQRFQYGVSRRNRAFLR